MPTSVSKDNRVEIDLLQWMSRFALQAIGLVGFNYNFNAFENDDDEYARALKSYLYVFPWYFVNRQEVDDAK